MATPGEGTPPQDDPFDLGDTSLGGDNPKPAQTAPATDTTTNVIDTGAGKQLPPRDPETGKFVKPALSNDRADASPNGEAGATASKHPSYLVEQATSFGYTEEEIEAMPTHILGKTMHRMGQEQLRFRDEMLRARQVSDGQVRAPQPPPTPVEEDIQLDWGQDEDGRQLTEKDFHPGVVKALKQIAMKQQKETKGLREELSKRDQRDEQRELNRAAAVYDAAFAALGKDYEHLVGTGPGREMGEDKKAEYRRRIAILTEAQADPRIHTVAQVKARVKAAADLLFPPVRRAPYAEVPKPGKPTNGQAPAQRITPEEWEEGGLARPTSRKAEEVKGEALAVRNLAAKMDQETIPDSEELDGFPE